MERLGSQGRLRVLLVSADEDLKDEVKEALTRNLRDPQLFWVSAPDFAIGRADELVPDVILVDDHLAGRDAVPLIRRLAASVSTAPVLALVREEATREAAQAVLAGARGFTTKPLSADDLIATLRQILLPGRETARDRAVTGGGTGRIVAFCAPKGGTGRTTLAMNVAASLRELTDQPVVLVDADYAAPALDVILNLDSGRDISELLPKITQLDERLVSSVLREHALGISVLLAPPPGNEASEISLPKAQQILMVLRRMFPWVVVDTGLPLNETAFAFLDSADRILVTALPEMVGLRNTRILLDHLRDHGYPDHKIWLVLNRADMSGGVSRDDIEERLKVSFEHTVPNDQPLVTHSINRGIPLVVSHPQSAVGRSIRDIGRKLVDELAPDLDVERAGLLKRSSERVRSAFKKQLTTFSSLGSAS
ncbi:MAG: AAA family ATPase [Chloroflexota bacterium]